MQNCLGITGVPPGIGGDQPGQVRVHWLNHPIVYPLVGDGRGELLPGDELAQVERIVVRQQADHIVAGIENKLANGGAIGRRLAEQRGGFLNVRVKLCADKIGDPLGAGEV